MVINLLHALVERDSPSHPSYKVYRGKTYYSCAFFDVHLLSSISDVISLTFERLQQLFASIGDVIVMSRSKDYNIIHIA